MVEGLRHERGRRWYATLRRRRVPLQRATDLTIWLLSVPLASLLVADLSPGHIDAWPTATVALGAVGVSAVFGRLAGIHRRQFTYAGFDEVVALTVATAGTAAVVLAAILATGRRPVPLSTPLVAGLLALAALTGSRGVARLLRQAVVRPGGAAEPVLVYGAGAAGTGLVGRMLGNPAGTYRPLGFVDDDPAKARRRVEGVRVLGTGDDLEHVAAATGARTVILAMPGADGETVRSALERAARAGLRTRILPSLSEPGCGAEADPGRIRTVTDADLLGRRQVDTDVAAIAGYVRGRRILVTGAGGSIGSELCRRLRRYGPERLIMLDRDESALHAVQLSIEGSALLDTPDLVVADIRDAERIRDLFRAHRPHVVFHAAALKHLPLLELHPTEAVKTNVLGTESLLAAAREFGVERFVNISTDKAVDPTSALGYTKRLAERLTAAAAVDTGLPYLSVRFGNVLGSRGSVLPAFRAMIDAGGPVTVTHPEVSRYFMTIGEAVELVIQAGAIGRGGEALVLDMGSPVRIVDLARRLIESSGRHVPIVFTGLRPGEKLHEDLLGAGEVAAPSAHPLISRCPVPPFRLPGGRGAVSPEQVVEWVDTNATTTVAAVPTAAAYGPEAA